jgi:hypothetical protein
MGHRRGGKRHGPENPNVSARRRAAAGARARPRAAAQSFPVPVAIDPAPAYDYIQQAASMSFDGETLTLSGLAPSTIYFSDRPYRETGQVDTATFLQLWDEGGSFADDPPNAALTVLSAPDDQPAVVELTSPQLAGSDLKYSVKVLCPGIFLEAP